MQDGRGGEGVSCRIGKSLFGKDANKVITK